MKYFSMHDFPRDILSFEWINYKNALEVNGSGAERRSWVLAADSDSDLPRWLIEIDRALAGDCKGYMSSYLIIKDQL